jgi:peptide/nickel transport system permease protein
VWTYFLKKASFFGLTLVFGLVFSFLLLHLAPGDPADLLLGEQAPENQKHAFREKLGLNTSLAHQFLNYWKKLGQGDLGESMSYTKPVSQLIAQKIPYTVSLALFAIALTAFFGMLTGILSAFFHKNFLLNLGLLISSVLGQSIPNFLLGPILVLCFSIYLPLFPVSGTGGYIYWILPSLTLSLSLFAVVSRMIHTGLVSESQKDYFCFSIAKGRSRSSALFLHAFRNVMIPFTHLIGLQLGALLTGAVVTEYIFDWPGMGSLFFSAVEKRDYPLIQGLVLLFTTLFASVNFAVDVISGLIDPRISRGAA